MKLATLSIAAVAAFGLAACQPAAETDPAGTAGDNATMPSPSTTDTSAMNPSTGQMNSQTMPSGSPGSMTTGSAGSPGSTGATGANAGTASGTGTMDTPGATGSTGSSTPPVQ